LKEIVVISGKGGTGKTSIVASFAALADNAVFADCDVDAADLHLILQPDIKQTSNFSGGKQASIIPEKCIGCGKCEEVCNFDAVVFDGPGNSAIDKTYTIDSIACEGCKVCVEFCPVNAIEFKDAVNGQWFISDTRFGVELTEHFGIPTAICINKYDINPEIAEAIEKRAGEKNLKVVGKISYDNKVTKAQLVAKSIVEYSSNQLREQIVSLWQSTIGMLNTRQIK